jgi:hypothetical protein
LNNLFHFLVNKTYGEIKQQLDEQLRKVSLKFRVYKFLVFSEILVHSFKLPILDCTNRECQSCWVSWWCSRKTSAQLRARISLKTPNFELIWLGLDEHKIEIRDLKAEVELVKKQNKMLKGRIRFLKKVGCRMVLRLLLNDDNDESLRTHYSLYLISFYSYY